MAIANVTITDTFYQWMVKTNQINYQSDETNQIAILALDTSNSATNIAVSTFARTNAAIAQANTGRDHANTAHLQANTARDHANAAHLQANTARTHANAAFGTANVVTFSFGQANTAFLQANIAYAAANSAAASGGPGYGQANIAYTQANVAYEQANTGRSHANTAYAQANGAYNQATLARGHANVSYAQANTARDHANVSFISANTARDQANVSFVAANTSSDRANTVWAAANNVTKGKHTIWVPATSIVARSTNGPEAGTIETGTNKIMHKTLDFNASTIQYAQFGILMPKSWNKLGVTAKFIWSHPSTTTNFGAVWGIQAMALADADPIDGLAFGTAVTVTDTGATANALYHTAETAEFTVAGSPGNEEYVTYQVYRAATDGADTLAVNARLVGVRLLYTTDAQTDD